MGGTGISDGFSPNHTFIKADREGPVSQTNDVPISFGQPSQGLMPMSALGPKPQAFPYRRINPLERGQTFELSDENRLSREGLNGGDGLVRCRL
jgi:hypothetical protein